MLSRNLYLFSVGTLPAIDGNMPTNILKSLDEVAVLLMMRHARTEQGRKVQESVLFRVETTMAIMADAQPLSFVEEVNGYITAALKGE